MPGTIRFLSKAEVAKATGLSLPSVNRRIADGSIPSIKLGGRVIIPGYFLDQLAESSGCSREE